MKKNVLYEFLNDKDIFSTKKFTKAGKMSLIWLLGTFSLYIHFFWKKWKITSKFLKKKKNECRFFPVKSEIKFNNVLLIESSSYWIIFVFREEFCSRLVNISFFFICEIFSRIFLCKSKTKMSHKKKFFTIYRNEWMKTDYKTFFFVS